MRELKYRKTDGQRLGAGRHARKAERQPVHVRKGDTVRVMRGDDKGKEGRVMKVFTKTGRARRPEEQSGIIEMPAPVNASNVMLLDPKTGRPTRTRARIDSDGTKERVGVKTG